MIETDEPRSEHLTLRIRPSELRRIEAAARASGVTRSHVLRQGALRLARAVLSEAAGNGGPETFR